MPALTGGMKTMNKIFAALPALALAAIAAPALAADLPAAAVVAAAPPAAPTTTTLAIEVSPEFKAAAGSTQNDLADWYAKGTLSYAIAPGWTIAGAGIPASGLRYDEQAARDGGGPFFDQGYRLMEKFLDLDWKG